MGGLGGVPWKLALLVVGLNLLGLCEGGETVVTLVPEGGIVVRAKFFIEVDVPYASSCRVPAEFTVVGVFVPLVIDEFAIVRGSGGVKVERTGVASMTGVGTLEIS